MVRNCACGGKLWRVDLRKQYDPRSPIGFYVVDLDRKAAHWECEKCHREYTQRKRQPRVKK